MNWEAMRLTLAGLVCFASWLVVLYLADLGRSVVDNILQSLGG